MIRNHTLVSVLAFFCTVLSAATQVRPVLAAEVSASFVNPASTVYSLAMPQIKQPIDNTKLSAMQNNVRPEIAESIDQGLVDDNLALNNMLLLLHRPDAQEQALDEFMAEQTTLGSPNYHNWLTAEQFGQYGVAQADISTITSWLESQGFTVNQVHTNGMVIDFSGTAGEVRQAFKTEVHHLSFNGVTHIANISVPEIPTALAPAVVGIVSIHDFRPHANNRPKSEYTYTGTNGPVYALVPADLATIYNLNPLFNTTPTAINGKGQTIALIEDEDPYTINDITTFRQTFGLPHTIGTDFAYTAVHPSCTDPGDLNDGTDFEVELDVEYAGAGAPGAALEMVSCGDSGTTFGGLIAMQNLLTNHDVARLWSMSYGECEEVSGATANAAFSTTFMQAAAAGISVFVSSGDSGAASCEQALDNPGAQGYVTKATHGITISGWASTPYNVAVGGTDFGDTFAGDNSTYWGGVTANSATFGSALSYINEIPWNNSCASQLIATKEGFTATYGTAGFCNSSIATGSNAFLDIGGGGGGPSACATGTASTRGVVSGTCKGTAKPSWQSIVGNPTDGVRDIPDISLFAANGIWDHYWVACYSNTAQGGTACTGAPSAWAGGGGTSFASPIMAGIQALVNQKTSASQGNPNPTYYSLASAEYGASGNANCNSSLGNGISSTCIFRDVTQGDMDMNCTGTNNCYKPSGTNGVLSTSNSAYQPAYGAATGWDFATGIGSLNAANLVNSWPGSVTTYTVTPSAGANGTISPSTPQTVNSGATTSFTVTPSTGYTASVAGTCGGTLVGNTYTTNAVTANCTVIASFTINTYTVTPSVSGSNGTISPNTPQTVNYNTTTTFTLTPATGYTASVAGTCGGTLVGNTYTTNAVTANCTVIASFTINTFTVTPSVSGSNGTISPNTPQTVNYNTTTTFTLAPATGYTGSVAGTCGGTLVGNTYTTNAVTANCTVIASFAINTYTVTPSVSGSNGTISPNTPQTVNYNTTTTFTLAPATGYTGSVAGTCGGTLVGNTYTTNAVTANCTVIASFTINTYTVTPSVSGSNGTISPNTPQTVNYNTTTTFTLAPATGYTGSVAGTCGGTLVGNTYTTNAVTANCTVIASFTINTFTVTPSVSGSNGTISPNTPQTVNYNTTTTFTLAPATGYTGSVAGTCGGTLVGNTYTTNAVTANCTVIASFAINTYTVTPSVSGSNGTISPNTPQTVNYNTTTTFTLAPATGYTGSVAGTCGGTLVGNTYTTNAVTANCTVIASFAINTYTLTYTAGANGTLSGSLSQTVNYGASGTAVTAVPNAGYHFVQWSDASTTNPRTDSNVTANVNVTASFAINTYTLTYTAGANGTISGASPQTVNSGASGTAVTAVPNTGYHFVQWSDASTTNPRTDANVTANVNVTASFAINTYTVTPSVSGSNGTISPNTPQTVNYNTTTTFTLTPATGYTGSVAGTCGGTLVGNTYTTNAVTANCTVIASFAINTFTVTPSVSGSNGTISPNTPQTVNYNTTTTFTLAPATGYTGSVAGTCGGTLVGNTYTTSAVTTNCTVIASFAINTYTLNYIDGANGTLSGTLSQTVNYGASGTAVTAVPNAGYHFVQWSDASTANPRTDSNVTANVNVTASFAINTYTLTYTAGANGTISGASPQTVNSGASGTAVTAVPNAGYHFVQWSDASTTNPRTDSNVTANVNVTASFAINTYTLTYTAGANGTLSGSLSQTVNYGASGTAVTAVPNAGYHFVQWSDASTTNPRTDTNITTDINVTASFALNQLVFTTQPADITIGQALNTVVVIEQDGNGNTVLDNNSSVDFSISACGGSVDLGSIVMINGVATLHSALLFYRLTSTPGLQINATTGLLNGTSQFFNVGPNADLLFADSFESCRL